MIPRPKRSSTAPLRKGAITCSLPRSARTNALDFLDVVAKLPNRAWIIYPAPVALDCELVLMVDAARMIDGEEPSEPADFSIEVVSPVATEAAPRRGFQTTACLFYMRCDDYSDWLIAGFNEEPPDWPTSS